ncbi:MAG: hypothetical protein Q8R39_04380 [bacterium]|nr:hypothetical protein [bacterium]MDZ4284575.1 hypothetical protein [Patescibacteria group bacterium]
MQTDIFRTHTLATPDNTALTELEPSLFYPVISAEEESTWQAWLPTRYAYSHANRALLHHTVARTLAQHEAPKEVHEELRFADELELFASYELRTPERRDLRDPLFIGTDKNSVRHRIALWGESIRPIGEIASIVSASRRVKFRGWLWRLGFVGAVAALSYLAGLELEVAYPARNAAAHARNALTFLTFSCLVTFFALVGVFLSRSPENARQDFLDRFRLDPNAQLR